MTIRCQNCGEFIDSPSQGDLPDGELEQVVDAAAELLGINPLAAFSRTRGARAVQLRRVCYLALRHAGLSYPEIGRLFGRDHTTVLSAVKTVCAADEVDAQLVFDRLVEWRRARQRQLEEGEVSGANGPDVRPGSDRG